MPVIGLRVKFTMRVFLCLDSVGTRLDQHLPDPSICYRLSSFGKPRLLGQSTLGDTIVIDVRLVLAGAGRRGTMGKPNSGESGYEGRETEFWRIRLRGGHAFVQGSYKN